MHEPGHNYEDEPVFVISIAARMVGMHAQSLRHYERIGLVQLRAVRKGANTGAKT